MSSKVATPFCIPLNIYESSCCSMSSLVFCVVSIPDFDYFNRFVVVSYCYFNLHFPDDIWCETYFHMLICHLSIFFGEVHLKISLSILKLSCLFCYCWVLRVLLIFWIVIYQMGLLKIFCPNLWFVSSLSWYCLSQRSF